MSWLEKLYATYEHCSGSIGDRNDPDPLLPICHTTQNAQIEIVIDGLGNFRRARVLTKGDDRTVIPCTEGSGGRSGSKPIAHPLCDKLQYVAGDFLDFGGEVTSGFKKKPKVPHESYLTLLSAWCQSPYKHPKVETVYAYVKRGSVIADLIKQGILPCDPTGTKLLTKWEASQSDQPEIFRIMPPDSAPEDAFVRWVVESGDDDPRTQLFLDESVWKSWVDYYVETKSSSGLCYVTGDVVPLATQHPAKLRNAADKAKIISANDSSGFTFRGRFTDKDGSQACGVGFDVTQKAHNALRWLIARQGRRDGTQAIVAWAPSGRRVPRIDYDSSRLFEDDFEPESPPGSSPTTHAEVGQGFALRLKKMIGGYRAELGDSSEVIVLALDSATPGRMAITYYRELTASDFLARIEKWHTDCCWHQSFGKLQFVGAPAPSDIAETAYGRRIDDKLLAAACRRLLPCIVDALPIPRDIVDSCVRRASSRNGIEAWEWEKALGIACSLYRQQSISTQNYSMSLEPRRTDRDYLFGRLLALAERLESYALYLAGETRQTNAARLMQRFAEHPHDTWRTLFLALDPYKARLRAKRPKTLHFLETEIDGVVNAFVPSDFTSSSKLSGEFLLGYHCQRFALRPKSDAKSDETTDSVENGPS